MKYEDKLFKGGYLFCKSNKFNPKNEWNCFSVLDKYFFYYDGSINCLSFKGDANKWCLLYGYAMDTLDWHMDLDKINSKLYSFLIGDFLKFYDYLDDLNGRFVLIFFDGIEIKVLNDATGMKSVYYHTKKTLISSHYNIIQNIMKEKNHPCFDLYNSITKNKPWVLPCDFTPFQNIKILISNHEYSLTNKKIKRFFPRGDHDVLSLNEIVDYTADHLSNQMSTLAQSFKPMLGVTAGMDSKTTLSSSYAIREKCVYFSYASEATNEKSPLYARKRKFDFDYASHICELYNLDFKKIELTHPIDNNLLEVAKKNHYHQHIFSCIQPIIESLPEDGIIVQSNLIEIVRDLTYLWTFKPDMSLKDQFVGWMMYWEQRSFVAPYVEEFIKENEFDKVFNYDILHLFYWEYRMTCWNNAATLVENDLAFNTYMAFNCRRLLNLGFSLSNFSRDSNLLNKMIINKLWPELLFHVENSDDTLVKYYENDSDCKLNFDSSKIYYGAGRQGESILEPVVLNRKYGCTFGFSNCLLLPKNWVQVEIPLNVLSDKKLILSLSSTKNANLKANAIFYEIKVDGKVLYIDDLSKVDSRLISLKVNETSQKLYVSLIVINEVNQDEIGSNAFVNIDWIKVVEPDFKCIDL